VKFRPEDFFGHDMSPPTQSVSRYGLEYFQAERVSEIANARLEEMLAEAADQTPALLHPQETIVPRERHDELIAHVKCPPTGNYHKWECKCCGLRLQGTDRQ
jgi:hypothetical protein